MIKSAVPPSASRSIIGVVSAGVAFLYVAGAASLAAIPVAIYYARRQGQKQKLLAYHPGISRWPLVSTRSLAAYRLAVVYTRTGGVDERIEAAFVHFLRFANFGREPIRREDIAPHNRLHIEVEGTRVLDFAVEAVRRPVCAIAVEQDIPLRGFEEATIDFDFLDYHDGAIVRILTTSRPERIELVGDIVGMPAGIVRADEFRKRPFLNWAGGILSAVAVLGVLGLTAVIFRWVTGSWSNAWLLALPLVGLVLLLVLIIVISETIWPKSGLQFPKELAMRFRGYDPMVLDPRDRVVMLEHVYFDEPPDDPSDPGQPAS
jgi:hypothetical protein